MVVDFKDFNMKRLPPQTPFEEKAVLFIQEWVSGSQTVSVQTSGSTGVPKILEVSKSRLAASARMTCDFLEIQEGDSALLCLPIEYISGKMMVVRAWERKLLLHIESSSTKPLEHLNMEIDFCAMSPLQVEHSLKKIHFIRKLIIGGAQVSENLKQKIRTSISAGKDTCIYETYGMSETLSHIAMKEIYPEAGECFTVLNGIDVSVDGRGCLKIDAPVLHDGTLQTNDLVELRSSREFKFIGRIDIVINSGGLKINPEALESMLKKYLDGEVVIIGVSDEVLGQKVILVVEGEESPEVKLQLKAALKEVETSFSKNHKPKEVLFMEKFPRTPNGKINRHELLNLL